jgi:hypothetical protein
VSLSYGILLPCRCEQVAPVLAHRFQHPKARLTLAVFLLAQQAALDERGDAGKGIDRPILTSHGLGRLQRATACKDGQAPEHDLLLGSEQVVAPGDGVAHGALA